ncbi:helix-turn-helix transcriptional regulator [Providencia stuartii]|uniref:XRE family transcriptional regulator n=1 Tax=Providencia TaxID=586 RepID=UPI0013A77CDB|nr:MULTISPECIES: helix-turn-helix transcriptional regulator [Providencia]ELR5142424.1 helix-turn-helix transcriptional regulator [Providencia stuartii]QIC15363.1 helix-turn-helix transcriptional regulator [Providencia vermicola]WER21527.1 helix-turn-helix transcriptional regulator [Providencia stuartii]WER25649.1 helix-turn-helix transcriptional regulator [Providencia stuartii]WER29737.1 helix-turn-helix transcriptional regulator [Providencia stuartii]
MNAETELFEKRRQKLAELVARYETQEEFARAIGKDKSYVSRMLYPPSKSGYKRIGDKMVLAIQDALGLPAGWMDGIVESEIPQPSRSYKVEVLDVEASAGAGVVVLDEFIETITAIEYSDEEAKRLFGGRPAHTIKMITVRGDSMAETFEPRDQIFVDMTVNHFDGDGIYVFILNNQLYIKRLQMQYKRLAVISDNPKYETWYLEENNIDGMFIHAKVLVSQSIKYKYHG